MYILNYNEVLGLINAVRVLPAAPHSALEARPGQTCGARSRKAESESISRACTRSRAASTTKDYGELVKIKLVQHIEGHITENKKNSQGKGMQSKREF